MSIINVESLTKVYNPGSSKGGIKALDEVSLEITPGEIYGLLGPNGAGKTTLFKVLLGITSITSGQASLSGLPPSNPKSRFKIGYLPENHRFPEYLTGSGLIYNSGYLSGLNKSQINQTAGQLLKLVGMEKWHDTKLRKYSKGMMQRIGLASALVNDPEIIFLDEPTDGVDPVGKAEIKQLMKEISSRGKTIILNSHMLSEVEKVAGRVAILKLGKIVRVGSVDDLTSKKLQYDIKAAFGEQSFEIPKDVGRVLSQTHNNLLVELNNDEGINNIIDQIRIMKISIKSVQPVKISLEQSFMDMLNSKQEN